MQRQKGMKSKIVVDGREIAIRQVNNPDVNHPDFEVIRNEAGYAFYKTRIGVTYSQSAISNISI